MSGQWRIWVVGLIQVVIIVRRSCAAKEGAFTMHGLYMEGARQSLFVSCKKLVILASSSVLRVIRDAKVSRAPSLSSLHGAGQSHTVVTRDMSHNGFRSLEDIWCPGPTCDVSPQQKSLTPVSTVFDSQLLTVKNYSNHGRPYRNDRQLSIKTSEYIPEIWSIILLPDSHLFSFRARLIDLPIHLTAIFSIQLLILPL